MSRFVVVVGLLGCNDAVTLAVTSDRPIPQAIDSMCLGIADVDPSGGHFGRVYRLEDKLATLPQTLRVDPGSADSAWAWVRGDRGGVPAIRAGSRVDFNSDVVLGLDACERGAAGEPAVLGAPVGPPSARLFVSHGANGAVVVAFTTDEVAVLEVEGGALVARAAPALAGPFVSATAADIDGDCDDDLVVATSAGPPELWRRTGVTFEPIAGQAGLVGDTAVAAIAAADVNRDGFIDLVTGGGGTLALYRNDGAGVFTQDVAALSAEGLLTSVRALALGDVDSDGNPDLVVGQAGDPMFGWLGDPDGDGSLRASSGVIAALPLDVVQLQLVDVDGDFDPDLVVTSTGQPVRIYLGRGNGLLENQTAAVIPDPVPVAHRAAIGGWDPGCEPDALFATDAATESHRGQPDGVFDPNDGEGPGATDVVMADIDDDGDLDAVIATPEGALWLAR